MTCPDAPVDENQLVVLRRVAFVLLVAVLAAGAAGCGRELPKDEPAAPAGGDPTGAFGEPGGGGGARIRLGGVVAAVKLGRSAARGYRTEDPDTRVVLREQEAGEAVAGLCDGTLDVAGTDRELTGAERAACRKSGGGAVELHLADAGGRPVYLVTTQDLLFDKLELESYLDFTVTNAVEAAQQAGLEPLEVEELDETQTRLEQGLAGVG